MAITAAEMLRRIKRITQAELQQETRKIIQRSQPLLDAKVNEFKRGETPDGSRIGYYSNPSYRLFKRQLNPLAGGTVDLILTGQFTRGLFVESKGANKFIFDSHDEKAPELFAKYGQENRGLNERVWQEVQKTEIAPLLTRYIKRQLGQI